MKYPILVFEKSVITAFHLDLSYSVRYSGTCLNTSYMPLTHNRVSSITLLMLLNPIVILSYLWVYPSPMAKFPYGVLRYLNLPHGVRR